MKKTLVSAALGLITLFTASASFAAGNSEKTTTADKGTLVSNGSTTTAYNKNGVWVYTNERFAADNLPKDVMDVVRNTYGSYYISGIEKLQLPGAEPVFIVHMQNETTIKTVQVSGNDAKITEDYIKG